MMLADSVTFMCVSACPIQICTTPQNHKLQFTKDTEVALALLYVCSPISVFQPFLKLTQKPSITKNGNRLDILR